MVLCAQKGYLPGHMAWWVLQEVAMRRHKAQSGQPGVATLEEEDIVQLLLGWRRVPGLFLARLFLGVTSRTLPDSLSVTTLVPDPLP